MEKITVGSLFDGIGGWQLAAERAGAVPVWSSEIDPFPMKVSRAHFPDTKQLGDIMAIRTDEIEAVDIICAGSPCQDLSIAGKREGLAGKRSNLFYQAMRIAWDMRCATNGKYPKFFVWENVPGAFSSNAGRDFQAVLAEISQADIPIPRSGKWARSGMVRSRQCDIAWRVLDAQFWGVPQHRERIFLIADFRDGTRRAEVLFEPEGVRGYFAPCENGGEGITAENGNGAPAFFREVRSTAYAEDTIGRTLTATGGTYSGGSETLIMDGGYSLRRLTPRECERLQGLPDDWTAYGTDTARYKAIGNGMAQPCADYVMNQVMKAIKGGRECVQK